MHIALVGAECEENLALRYIRAALEQTGHTVTQVPFNTPADTEPAARALAATGAPLAGFSMVFTYRAREFAALAQRARALGYRGHFVAGGHFAAFNADALLHDAPAFDSVAIGEGEELMGDLAGHLDSLGAVRGLVWRDPADVIRHNAPSVKPPDLARLPQPTRLDPPDAYLGLPIANLLGSRGCSHACAFCSIAAWHKLCGGPRFRLREPAAVAAEVAGLYHRGYRIFNFHDDNFFLTDTRASFQRYWRFGAELQRHGVGRIAFSVKSRPDSVDADLFAYLKELGMFRVFLGIEAGTVAALRDLGRGQTLDDNTRALETVNRLDLHACFNLLLLNPDSTLEDFRANVAFLRAHAANPMNFCRTEIYSGTPLETRLRQQGRLLGSYWGYGYAIADPRAQTVFELMYLGLTGRHYGDGCVQHLTMRVDFERQLLAHFHHCPPQLRRQTKDFIRRVNLNSCDYLEEIVDRVAAGFAQDDAKQDYLEALRGRVQQDNDRFGAEADALLVAINQKAAPPRPAWGAWHQDAAAILLASSVALAAPIAGGQTVVDPVPPPMRADSDDIAPQLRTKLLPLVALRLAEPMDVQVRAVFNARGTLSAATIQTSSGESIHIPQLIRLGITDPNAHSKVIEVAYTKAEVAAAREAALTPPAAKLPDGDPATLRPLLRPLVLRQLAALLETPRDVELELWLDEAGNVTYAAIRKAATAHSAATTPNAPDLQKAKTLITQLSAETHQERQAAHQALEQMGRGVLPLIRETFQKTTNPEIKLRTSQLIEALDDQLVTLRLADIVMLLRSQRFANPALGGKRYIFTLKKQDFVITSSPDNTHMFEMAPAPAPLD